MICFHIIEESNTRYNKYRDTRLAWTNISRKIDPATGVSKTRLHNKFSKYKLHNVTRNPKECINELELLIGDQ